MSTRLKKFRTRECAEFFTFSLFTIHSSLKSHSEFLEVKSNSEELRSIVTPPLLCYNTPNGGDDMKKFKVTSYHKSNALTSTNGGTLIITDTEYIIKYLFITVAKYKIDDTIASKISFVSKGLNLNDGEKQIDLYFFPKTAQKVYELLNLK